MYVLQKVKELLKKFPIRLLTPKAIILSISVTKENIECKDNYAMSADAPATYEFRCGDDGMFNCADGQNGCPKCEGLR